MGNGNLELQCNPCYPDIKTPVHICIIVDLGRDGIMIKKKGLERFLNKSEIFHSIDICGTEQ